MLKSKANILLLLIVLGIGISCFLVFPPETTDDSYITYRYAYNLYNHKQFVFNLDERILGTTTPLYTLMLTALQVFSEDIPRISVFVSFVSLSLSGFLIFLILKEENLPVGLFGAICFPFIFRHIGLETSFLMFLFALGMYLFAEERYLPCSAVLGLSFLTRQDSAVFILCVIFMYWLRRRRMPWRELLVFVSVVAPWFLFSYFYFGSLLPETLEAKKGHVSFIQYFYNAFWYLARYCDVYNFKLFSFLSEKVTHFVSPGEGYRAYVAKGSLCMLYFPIILLGVIYYVRNARKFDYTGMVFYIYPLLMIVVLSFIAPPPGHHWHLGSAVGFALIGQLNLITAPVLSSIRREPLSLLQRVHFSKWVVLMMGAYFVYFAGLNIWRFHDNVKRADDHAKISGRFNTYKNIGLFLRDNVSDGETVFVLEVGTMGYYGRRHMIDGAGLISPGYDTYHRKGCWLMGIERDFPDYIVAEEVSIPYYEPIYSVDHNLGRQVVYKKLEDLPESDYPFSDLIENWKEYENRTMEKPLDSEEYVKRRTGMIPKLTETVLNYLLNKYRR